MAASAPIQTRAPPSLLGFEVRGTRPAVSLVEVSRLPHHVAIIMDGNGRWAELLGHPRTEGHHRGSDAVRRIVRAGRRLGLGALTLYAFSEQNWGRPELEVQSLMQLLRDYLVSEREEILAHRIRLRAIGRVDRLPSFVREVLDPLERESASHEGMLLSLALSYGGREEIVDATRTLGHAIKSGTLEPTAIDETLVAATLPSMLAGPVDLMIRTGGEQRISNFLLWSAAYAELYFEPKLWPDYDVDDLYRAIGAYQVRERRFGQVLPSPIASEPDAPQVHA